MLGRYSEASVEYLVALLYRIGDIYGIDLRVEETERPNNPMQQTSGDKTPDAAHVEP
jgi:hypothetical protein